MFSLTQTASFLGRHWLRLLVILAAVVFLNQKQISFNVHLGKTPGVEPTQVTRPEPVPPAPAPPPETGARLNTETEVLTEESSTLAGIGSSLLGLFSSSSPRPLDALATVPDAEVAAFVRRFSHVAQAEQEKFRIPASITLANGLLFSRAGKIAAVGQHNAYFRLPCDLAYVGARGDHEGHCVRAYQNAWTSFRDHSLYLTNDRYSALSQFGPNDYRRWAAGLEELGFNETEGLAEQLVTVIDRYQLFRFD